MLAPAPEFPLVSAVDYAQFYGAQPTVEQAARMAAAGAAVRRWCGWHIAPVLEQTFTVDARGGRVLRLPTLRLVELVALSNDGVDVDLETVPVPVEWSHDGYLFGSFSRRLRGVQVTIRHGHESAADLAQILTDLAGRAQPAGITSKTKGSVSVTYAEPGLMGHEREQMGLFRLPRIP